MVMAWGAIAILLNPNLSQRLASDTQRHQSPSAKVITQQKPRSQDQTRPSPPSNDPALAFWTFGAVAIACGYGSIILSQHIKPSKRR
ncbi:MAG: hypothetical protein F6K30_09830 [Cyanothece sp. SIO2G6]|nr:hypothetical protein [Cyanothece sp. SIO2G6]